MGERRDLKFGEQVDHSKSQLTDVKASIQRARTGDEQPANTPLRGGNFTLRLTLYINPTIAVQFLKKVFQCLKYLKTESIKQFLFSL